jgi:multiple sugar transport system permease protein
MPLIKPAIATMAILAFQAVWNNVETSDIFINEESLRTLAFYMDTLSGGGSIAGAGVSAAAALVMFLPNLIIFIFMQSKVMDTMAHSGIK